MRAAVYVGRFGGLAVALGVGAAVVTGWGCGEARADTTRSAPSSSDESSGSTSSSTGTTTSGPGAVSGTSASAPSTASGSTEHSTESSISTVTSKSASVTPEASSHPATRSTEAGAVLATGGAHTSSPIRSAPSTGAATATRGSDPDSTAATAPAPSREGGAASGPAVTTTNNSADVAKAPAAHTATTPILSATATTASTMSTTVRTAADVSGPESATVATPTATVTTPVDIVADPSRLTAGAAPGLPAQTPALLTLLAFARRELEQTISAPPSTVNPVAATVVSDAAALAGQPMGPATTAGTGAATADVSVVTALNPQPTATTAPATYTGQPSILTQITVLALRVTRAILAPFGLNPITLLTPLIVSDNPPWFTTLGLNVQRTEYAGMPVYTIESADPSGKYVVGIHGGGFILGPTILHWFDYAQMARDTGATVVVPVYPLAPQGTAGTVIPTVADLISSEIDQHGTQNVSVYGDSAGAQIALTSVQELVRRGDPVPSHMVLISPPVDLTYSNPAISLIDDPVLSVPEAQAHAELWAGDLPLTDPLVSPLYGSLAGLPPTAVYSGSLEILAPDTLLLQDKALATPGADFTFVLRNGEVHDWAMGGIPTSLEAVAVRPQVYQQLGIGTNA
jgi:triacylglycerol lipase